MVPEREILACLPMVKAIAREVHASLPPQADLDDLVQEGCLGLLHAARYYEDRSHKFSTYARHRIYGAIHDYLRQSEGYSRRGTSVEMCQLGVGEPKTSPTANDTKIPPGLRLLLLENMQKLSNEQRSILDAVYFKEDSLDRICSNLGVTKNRIHHVRRGALVKLHSMLAPLVLRDLV